MKIFKSIAVALSLSLAAPAFAAQNTIVGPVVGPQTMANVMTILNAALLSIQSCNSGNSAPANGVSAAPTQYQCWADTSASPVVSIKMYDGTNWVTKGKLNTSTHVWTPVYQGTDAGTAIIANTGASGHTIPFLDVANTWSADQSFNSGTLKLNGSTSGTGTLNPPAVASTYTWTLPAITTTLGGLAAAQTWTGVNVFNSGSFNLNGSASGQTQVNSAAVAGSSVLTLPAGTDTLVGKATTDALTNKTFDAATGGNTFKINGNTATASAGTATLTFPNSTDTMVGRATTDTLTNKTLTLPIITSISNGGTLTLPTGADTLLGRATTDTLTNKTVNGANNTLTVLAGTQLSGQTPIANGGTGQATAAAARGSSGLNVERFTGVGNTNYTILSTDQTVGTNAAFTVSRTWTLPAANAVNAGQSILVADFQGTVTGTNTLVIQRAGSDTINGATSVTIAVANGGFLLVSDGSSKWTAQAVGAASGGGVSSVTCGTGLSGGTITTSGTCAVNLSFVTNSLGADVALNNTANYFDGPSVSQGTSGTWDAKGTVTLNDTGASASNFYCKLWDGTTVIASANTVHNAAANQRTSVALSGVLVSPAANIRISCRNLDSTNAVMEFNRTGNSKDSTVTAVRIN